MMTEVHKCGSRGQIPRFRTVYCNEKIVVSPRKEIDRLPVVFDRLSGVQTEVVHYIRDQLSYGSPASGSIADEVGILCDWLNWLAERRRNWDAATEPDYLGWSNEQASEKICQPPRQGRKAWVIWNFYRVMLKLKIANHAIELLFESISKYDGDTPGIRFKAGRYQKAKSPRVPGEDDVQRIVDELGAADNRFIGERNWLMARFQSEMGLRAMGVHCVSIDSIDQALRLEGILGHNETVGAMRNNGPERSKVRSALRQLTDQDRTSLELDVVEKGNKGRMVPLPILLALDVLSHLWGERQRLIQSGRGGASFAKAGNALFLSSTDGRPLRLGSMKDIVADKGFEAAGVPNSGHKLRAFFLTNKAVELVKAAQQRHGVNYDAGAIMIQLAELAGHNDQKTLASYIDQARLTCLFKAKEGEANV